LSNLRLSTKAGQLHSIIGNVDKHWFRVNRACSDEGPQFIIRTFPEHSNDLLSCVDHRRGRPIRLQRPTNLHQLLEQRNEVPKPAPRQLVTNPLR
ncbi:MAG: hypothetical protein WAK19_10205, partial [Candidatus Cybelea sp.]